MMRLFGQVGQVAHCQAQNPFYYCTVSCFVGQICSKAVPTIVSIHPNRAVYATPCTGGYPPDKGDRFWGTGVLVAVGAMVGGVTVGGGAVGGSAVDVGATAVGATVDIGSGVCCWDVFVAVASFAAVTVPDTPASVGVGVLTANGVCVPAGGGVEAPSISVVSVASGAVVAETVANSVAIGVAVVVSTAVVAAGVPVGATGVPAAGSTVSVATAVAVIGAPSVVALVGGAVTEGCGVSMAVGVEITVSVSTAVAVSVTSGVSVPVGVMPTVAVGTTVASVVTVIVGTAVAATVTVMVGATVAVTSTEGVITVVEIAVSVTASGGCVVVGVLTCWIAGANSVLLSLILFGSTMQLTRCNWATVVPVRWAIADKESPVRTA